jgi:DNA helicase IV
MTAERLLRELFADPGQIAAATPGWTDEDRALLHRSPDAAWTPADVPLLEEADELLGTDDAAERSAARRERQRRRRHAQETLDLLHGSRSFDAETEEESEELSAVDLLDAESLAARQEEVDTRSTAERAAADRTWTFGHVIVDEAQELSAMAWRTVLRRVPTRSMTVVGDVAQTGSLAGASSWADVLRPHLGPQGQGQAWRLAELTVNYRTPTEIMAVAADVLAATATGSAPPTSVRSTGVAPFASRAEEAHLAKVVAEVAADLAEAGGTLAVVAPPSRVDPIAEAVQARLPETGVGAAVELTAGVAVLTPTAVKGLEFDSVLVVDPQGIVDEGVRGLNDLYVALTRATQRLGVVHPGELPDVLASLAG